MIKQWSFTTKMLGLWSSPLFDPHVWLTPHTTPGLYCTLPHYHGLYSTVALSSNLAKFAFVGSLRGMNELHVWSIFTCITAAILVFQNKEMAAILGYQAIPLGIKIVFCLGKPIWLLVTQVNMLHNGKTLKMI